MGVLGRVSNIRINPVTGQPVAKPTTPARGPDAFVKGGKSVDIAATRRGAEGYFARNASYDPAGLALCGVLRGFRLEASEGSNDPGDFARYKRFLDPLQEIMGLR